jgi:hypothetical protein
MSRLFVFSNLWLVVFFGATIGLSVTNGEDPAAATEVRLLGGLLGPMSEDNPRWEIQFHLAGRELTDDGLVHVTALGAVESLNLSSTKITSAGLVHLKGLTDLRVLHLERTAIGDDGAKHLTGLVNLEYLNLYDTKVTDASLTHLVALRKLKQLFLWRTDVSDEGVATLQKALPALTIVRGVDFSKLPSPPPPKPVAMLKWTAGTDGLPEKSTTGASSSVTFENRTDRRVKLVWIAYDGSRKFYGDIEAGVSRQQNTYSEAYWLITDEKDMPIGYFKALPDDCKAVIPR